MSPPAPSLLVSQPSDETEEDLENLMEDSGHGLDIGSLAAVDESRVASTSDEEEEGMEVERASRGVERRRPRRSRVAYKVGVGSRKIRVRQTGREQEQEGGSRGSSDSEGELFSSSSAAEGGLSSRDLSPVEMVREYIQDFSGEMVEDFERICERVGNVRDEAVAQGARIVHRTKQGGAEIVQKSKLAAHAATQVPAKVLESVKHWNHLSFAKLPAWMKDNEFIKFYHRPELNSVTECFKSILGVHSETGNIWTHLIGFIAFVICTIVFYVKPLCDQCHTDLDIGEKLIFLFFFIGAILCLGLSFLFHTLCCHSEHVSKLFCKLDYVGISLLTVGSFVPWIYYGFYCQYTPKVVYLSIISVLGIACIAVTMMDKFSDPLYRPVRALLFVCLGLFGLVPTVHFLVQSGWSAGMAEASIHRVLIMGGLYILGAVLYGCRIPERFLPGKFDIWFQSHQIFHVLVIAAAFVHYHGMANMAVYRLTKAGQCSVNETEHPAAVAI